jgi:Flp pilus assembly pilin Flp
MARLIRSIGHATGAAARSLIWRSDGADIVEYAILAFFFGIVGVVVFNLIQADLFSALTNWDTNVQGAWAVPNPGAGS